MFSSDRHRQGILGNAPTLQQGAELSVNGFEGGR